MNPSDPSLPAALLAGPYGFLVVIFFCLFWGLREWRKGRDVDVAAQRKRAEEAEQRADIAETQRDTLETKAQQDSNILVSKVEALQGEIRTLRETNFREVERAMEKYYAARAKMQADGYKMEDIP